MRLAVIEPAKPGDKLIFECTECGRGDSIEVEFREQRKPGSALRRHRPSDDRNTQRLASRIV
jgi:hypothetical protein